VEGGVVKRNGIGSGLGKRGGGEGACVAKPSARNHEGRGRKKNSKVVLLGEKNGKKKMLTGPLSGTGKRLYRERGTWGERMVQRRENSIRQSLKTRGRG